MALLPCIHRRFTLVELIREAVIEEVDQDGGTLRHYGLEDADTDVAEDASLVIALRYLVIRRAERA